MRETTSARVTWAVTLMALTLMAVMIMGGVATGQEVQTFGPTAGQESDPYQAPIASIDPPSWLEPLGPLATLPVWATAAVLAALAAALFILVPALVRWVWSMRRTRDSET